MYRGRHRYRSALALGLLVGFLTAAPAPGQILVMGNTVQEQGAAPGGEYTGEILLRNQSPEPQAVRVYQTDYLFYADGSNLYPDPGSHPRSNAGWLQVSPTDLVIPGGQDAIVSYEVRVPSEGVEPGTYWSMIMIEPTGTPEEAESPEAPSIGLRTTVRFGMQVATHVEGTAEHRLRLGEARLDRGDGGAPRLLFEVINEGAVGYRPEVAVEIYDASGNLRLSRQAERGLIYPGTSVLQAFDLSDLTPGAYEAVLVVDTGGPQLFGGRFTLVLDAGDE